MSGSQRTGRDQWEGDLFRLLMENVQDYAIVVVDAAARVQTWNAGAQRLLGYPEEEIIGCSAEQFFTPEDIANGLLQQEMQRALRTGRSENDHWYVRKDGSRFWSTGVMTPLRGEDGAVRGFAKIMRDMTERKRAEQEGENLVRQLRAEKARLVQTLGALAESESRYRTIGELIPFGVWMRDAQAEVVHVSSSFLEMLGLTLEEFGRTWPGRVHPDDRERMVGGLPRRLQSGQPWEEEFRIRGKDGVYRSILTRGIPVRDDDGRVLCWVGINLDLTERKRATAALRQSEEKYRQIVETAIEGIWLLDADARITFVNPRMAELLGRKAEDMLGRPQRDFVFHGDRARAQELFERRRVGISEQADIRLLHHDGGPVWALMAARPLVDAEGRFQGALDMFTDINERKRVEQALRFLADGSAALATLVDYSSTLQRVAGLAVPSFADWCAVDMVEPGEAPGDGQPITCASLRRVAVVHTDPAKVKLAHELHKRYPPDPNARRCVPQVLRTGASDMMAEIPDDLIASAARDAEHLRLLRQLGFKSYLCVPLKGRGRLLGALSFVMAESGRRYSQADLAFAEEMARRASIAIENAQLYAELRETDRRKDEYLAMLAHELRNPLGPIRNALHIMKQAGANGELANRARDMAERQVQHMARLLDDLLDVSRISRGKIELRKEIVDVATLVSRTVEATRGLIEGQRHELTVTVPAEALLAEADPTRLEQVLANLLNNAAKYTDPGGHIWLTARREGAEVVLEVRDTGIGIAADVLPHIFDLFVQGGRGLDRSRGGVGIGLTLVKMLVDLHDGSIEAHSPGVGQGSSFVVRLPVVKAAGQRTKEARNVSRPLTAAPGPARKVLVVDDKPDAADSLAMLLRMQGHDVRAVNDGPAALAEAEKFKPELVFLDIGMPGMDGYEVARKLRQQPGHERMLLVAVTGWGQEEDRRRSFAAGFDRHLVKPVEPKDLTDLLAALPGCRLTP